MIIERVITVEYLHPSMSKELLCKFPDFSAFDFDYSQSGIWSPLLSRGRFSTLISDSSMEIRKKLLDGFEKTTSSDEEEDEEKFKNNNLTRKIKNKIGIKMMMKKKQNNKNNDLDLSITPIKGSTPHKGWTKILRAASKQFKKQKSSSLQMKLPNFLRNV